MTQSNFSVEFSELENLRPPLQATLRVLQEQGGRITAQELQGRLGIGLSTAYTYLNELFMKDLLERVKIMSGHGSSKQFLYVMKVELSACVENGGLFSDQGDLFSEAGNLEESQDDFSDPLEGMLDILWHLSEKVKRLEAQVAYLENERQKHYPQISALKKDINFSPARK